jgi:hypothetical protein
MTKDGSVVKYEANDKDVDSGRPILSIRSLVHPLNIRNSTLIYVTAKPCSIGLSIV